jgi:hypothetical protein
MVDNRKFSVRTVLKKIFPSIIIFLSVFTVEAKIIGKISSDYFKRPLLRIDDTQIYIVDQALKKGFIYDRNNFEKKSEFGGPGQGPGEFPSVTYVTIDDKNLYVSTQWKVSIFSKKGKYIKDIKSVSSGYEYSPIGNNFVGTSSIPGNQDPDHIDIQFNLYDSNLKKKKSLLRTTILVKWNFKGRKEIIYFISDYTASYVYNNAIYIGTTGNGFFFSVFNPDGEKLYDIKLDGEKKKITEKEKQKKIDSLRLALGEKRWKSMYGNKEIKFPDYYPAYQAFFVNDGRIYVFSYPREKQYEVYIIDLKGNVLERKFMPTNDLKGVNSKYQCMSNGNLYQLRLGADEEEELHEIKIYK